jgi:DNA-binding XRE family transcriptional regulator
MCTTRKRPIYFKLKAFFVENGINQDEPANLLGVTRATFNSKINGTGSDFSLQEARKLCEKYSLKMDDYFTL